MNWLNNLQDFFISGQNTAGILTAVLLFVSLLLALIIGGLIGSAVSKRHIAAFEQEGKTAVIAALIDAATEASVWNALNPQEQVNSDRAVSQIDIRIRLLPVKGSGIAADWAAHQLGEMKRNSATFGYQLDPAVAEFRDRLLLWLHNPKKATKIFTSDLQRWSYATTAPEAAVVAAQEEWVAQQHHEAHSTPEATSTDSAVTEVIVTETVTETVITETYAAPAAPAFAPLVEDDILAALRSPQHDDDDAPGVPKMF
jgi:hypothetical protein